MGFFAKSHKDPVCGMKVEVGKQAAKATHDGKAYYFCSAGCAAKFEATPAQFA